MGPGSTGREGWLKEALGTWALGVVPGRRAARRVGSWAAFLASTLHALAYRVELPLLQADEVADERVGARVAAAAGGRHPAGAACGGRSGWAGAA
jgi:hypothetical protein